ncbi:type II/IV secretion system ATPase subunit [Candidatus Woesearchaeota archaeon]|nr:type II/IV secretion system ATPase subunit [Candidatus Woesearchaeota archaeon]MCF7900701.1 type II/IV secretion system ATPase subunit [Candidatus Woesearchaeota archaeon]MCF8013222.1 type II/IV secretion system ATPase subunit [Candidatus Woesearchaeota archaeon]
MEPKKRGRGFFKDYDIEKEGADNVLLINYENIPRVPSLEDDSLCMAKTNELILSNPNITKIVFAQKHDYEYEYDQVKLLIEIVSVYKSLIKNKELFTYQALNELLGEDAKFNLTRRYNETHNLIFNQLLRDPIGTYIEITRTLRKEKIELDKEFDDKFYAARKNYITLLEYVMKVLENTNLIQIAMPYTAGYKIGERDIYRKIFTPNIKPDFMFTKIMASYPKDAEEVMNYNIGETEVIIFKTTDNIQYLYHVTPPEFKLSEEKYEVLDMARKILSEHQPEEQDFVNPQRMREIFYNVGTDLLQELSEHKKLRLTEKELEELTQILIRYTVGFGLIEILLEDEHVQDITINSPTGETPIFLVHGKFNECRTNIIPSISDAESWASKLRLLSGRPLDEANPILDTDIEIPNVAKARVGVISRPLNPTGIAYAFRRHRDKPWTLPLFIKNKMITPLGAGLISFIVDGNRTMLVAGTRSAGKSSLLGAVMVEIMRKYRIITIEDTLELPGEQLRKLEYNIQSMKVASALSKGTSEVSADEGIRTTLRLGDSALIVGEVRSTEAQALYEAMRVGALANVVAGTIHGDSPYGVYDRVVNDLKVPKTSFKATDIIIVANPIRSADGLHKWRRVTQISEVRKDWEDDPMLEKGFVDLMRYNSKTDKLEPTDELLNGDSEILKAIAGNVKDWTGNWDAVWDNILLRAKTKEALLELSEKENDPEILEAPFIISSNDQFHRISDKIIEETGTLNSKKIFMEWHEWAKTQIKRKKAK